MNSLGKHLLFLHGHIADPDLARRLAAASAGQPPRERGRRRSLRTLVALWSARFGLGIGGTSARPR